MHTFAQFSRTDGPADRVAHDYLAHAPVALQAADVAGDEPAIQAQGVVLSLLGTADAATHHTRFAGLAEEGEGA